MKNPDLIFLAFLGKGKEKHTHTHTKKQGFVVLAEPLKFPGEKGEYALKGKESLKTKKNKEIPKSKEKKIREKAKLGGEATLADWLSAPAPPAIPTVLLLITFDDLGFEALPWDLAFNAICLDVQVIHILEFTDFVGKAATQP